ncbi:GNAT family N-acetyltransferase [Actinopolymorpha singaporensis]|uniref:Ribosomal protein S18 acetylase RimI n=1 Tax=Actinopolymorpha singaporensis TaxID=117157 RepID=A0A1H1XFE3_9ACTN|nr:GNAT family N-acetyltransferase [Actinopolymorpha singaporensis]SDT07944.1 Ribosomal protein S18 acetylase RimI [Actinopolymorpha singaporensis]
MSDQIIDVFKADRLDAAARLFVSVFNAEPWNDRWSEASVRARLADVVATPGFVGVALQAGQDLHGFAIGHTEQWFTGRHFLLQEMCVRTDLQRQGVGAALLDALEARLVDVEQIYLLTEQDGAARRGAAQRFYERCGFRAARRTGVMTKRIPPMP